MTYQKLAIFLPSFAKGGVERMMVNLAKGFAATGQPIDFVVKDAGSPYIAALPETAKLIKLDSIHPDLGIAAALYLEQAAPHAILTSKEENDEIALRAKARSGASTRVIVRVPVHITSRLKHKRRGPLKVWKTYSNLKRITGSADSVVAVSEGVAMDVSTITGIPLERIHVIRNPVITPELRELAGDDPNHRWFSRKDKPVVLGIGRLGQQKNFELLIHAFSRVRANIDSRLLILGEGRRRTRMEKLVKKLGIAEHVELLGFVANPYAYLSRADLFVLSSKWEGSPNVLTEALAVGVPVVSTDCDSGPREILQNGKYGELVPVSDVRKLADAMINTLSKPPDSNSFKEAVSDYTVEKAAGSYLKILLGQGGPSQPGTSDRIRSVAPRKSSQQKG